MAKRNIISLALTALFVLSLAVGASAGIPDTYNSTASAENCGRFTIAPGGAEDLVNVDQNYRIHVTVLDINGDPVVTLAATDLYLNNDNLLNCSGIFSQADFGTDVNGDTEFSGTIYSGLNGDAFDGIDCDAVQLYVYALGIVLNSANPVCVAVDSPELTGDNTVTAADFAKFAVDFNCVSVGVDCDPCHDFTEDGETTAADFAVFAVYFNDSVCP
jgi:hypothetical protein